MKPGSLVKISTKEAEFEGQVLPRPEMLDKGILVLKLDSGYNIGIKETEIISTKVLEETKETKKEHVELKQNPDLPTIAILSTGGTISSSIDYSSGGVKAITYDASDFAQMCPEVMNHVNIESESIDQIMSEDMDFSHIETIAAQVKKWVEKEHISGIVLTCGTDMLHYISAGLSFLLQGLPKPIVITASQRSIDRGSSDAFMNLACAMYSAAYWKGAEVITCLHGSSDDDHCLLLRGSKVRKMHTSRRDAFRPINILPLGIISYPSFEIKDVLKTYTKRANSRIQEITPFSSDIELLHVYPNIDGSIIEHFISQKKKGIVIAGTALGHVPTVGQGNILPQLQKAIDAGMIIVIATQTLYGRTHPFVYTNLRKLSLGLGCIYAEDMLPETAYMKLSYLCGKYEDSEKIKEEFTKNLAGEINPILDEDNFLY